MSFIRWYRSMKQLSPSLHRDQRVKRNVRSPACRLDVEELEGRILLSFTGPLNFNTGHSPQAIAMGDFNRDGKLDLVTANRFSDNVSVLLGKDNGTFQGTTNYDLGSIPVSVAVGDFNRDGKPDLAVANEFGDSVSVLRGKSDGTFSQDVKIPVGQFPSAVAVGDFNRDGKQAWLP